LMPTGFKSRWMESAGHWTMYSLDYAAPDEKYYSRDSTCFTKKRVIVPESSWLLRPRAMEQLNFEECVEIYKSGISWEEHLKVA